MTLFDTVSITAKVILLLNVIALIFVNTKVFRNRNERMSKQMALLMLLLFGVMCIEFYSLYLYSYRKPNLFLTHYYTFGQFILISIIYYGLLNKFRLAIPIGLTLFSCVIFYQLYHSMVLYDQFNTLGFLVSSCSMMAYAFFYYIEHISQKQYWDSFNVGLFLYLGGSSIIFFTMNLFKKDLKEWYMVLWIINASLAVLYQIFISITIYRYNRLVKNQNGYSSL